MWRCLLCAQKRRRLQDTLGGTWRAPWGPDGEPRPVWPRAETEGSRDMLPTMWSGAEGSGRYRCTGVTADSWKDCRPLLLTALMGVSTVDTELAMDERGSG